MHGACDTIFYRFSFLFYYRSTVAFYIIFLFQVSSLFDNEKAKHVESFKYHLVRYEKVEQGQQSGEKDHSVFGHERRNMMRKPIELKDLFERRSLKPNEPTVDVLKVLLVGNPGTGK